MAEPMYALSGVLKRYGHKTAVLVERLDICRGEVLALVGPSGAGKSTLLRLLNFLEPPTSGHVDFDGARFDAETPMALAQRRRVTTVFQRPALLRMSVRDNVAYGLRLRGEAGAGSRAADALRQVGLQDLARSGAATLSGGEAQRVALARALAIAPEVLLLDEPTANLDPANVRLIEAAVLEHRRARGCACVWVTHNLAQARRVADRVALMLEGQLVEVAPAAEFFSAPKDPRTAAFVGGEMVW
ncbi:MAG: phosphate ABC transporter ATP-binding protein [Anaerolineae bacterium]|nr:phosphate ABC transporter ATP-binding protein [Anaerolineae bacterium]